MKTLVLGGSINPNRYSNMAIKSLRRNGIETVSVGNKTGWVDDVQIEVVQVAFKDIDTVSLYLGPNNQTEYYNYILALKPRRIIFNPGTENDELKEKASKAGITTLEACTLVMLSTGQY